jgi:hypothetical protein
LNTKGELGTGSNAGPETEPVISLLTSDAIRVSAGYQHTCALLSGGGAKCCRSFVFLLVFVFV